MIIGIGFDVVEVERIRRAMLNSKFAKRILTPLERQQTLNTLAVAGRWAAKEAIYKASPLPLTWQQIEIENLPSGAPIVRILRPDWDHSIQVHLSISHERSIGAAIAILEARTG